MLNAKEKYSPLFPSELHIDTEYTSKLTRAIKKKKPFCVYKKNIQYSKELKIKKSDKL